MRCHGVKANGGKVSYLDQSCTATNEPFSVFGNEEHVIATTLNNELIGEKGEVFTPVCIH